MDELQSVLEGQIRQLASSILGGPQSSTFYRSAEANMSMSLRGHERMFSRWLHFRWVAHPHPRRSGGGGALSSGPWIIDSRAICGKPEPSS